MCCPSAKLLEDPNCPNSQFVDEQWLFLLTVAYVFFQFKESLPTFIFMHWGLLPVVFLQVNLK